MPARKYPLDPLVKQRAQKVEAQTRELAGAVTARDAAEKKRLAAEDARARAEGEAAKTRSEERAALEDGELRAGDLQRAQAWEVGVSEERKRLTEKVATAKQSEDDAKKMEAQARADLALREADAEVVEKDQTRFVAREYQRELAKEEEAAVEAWRPRRS